MSSLTCAAGHAEGSQARYLASQSRLAQISRLPGCAGSAGTRWGGRQRVAGMSSLTWPAGHAKGSEACYSASQNDPGSANPGFQAAQGLLALSMRLSTRGRDEQPHMPAGPSQGSEACCLASQSTLGADIPASRLRRVCWHSLGRATMCGRDEQPHMCSRPC